MTVDAWLKTAIADAERRGLSEMKPILESLAQAVRALRNVESRGEPDGPAGH